MLVHKPLSRKFFTHDQGRSPDLRLVTNLPINSRITSELDSGKSCSYKLYSLQLREQFRILTEFPFNSAPTKVDTETKIAANV